MRCPATEHQALHMAALQAMTAPSAMAEYIKNVRATEGNFYADWLRDEYSNWFWEFKAQQRNASTRIAKDEDDQ